MTGITDDEWISANRMCMDSGANLWEPTNAVEYNAVRTQFNSLVTVWTGANDRVNEGDVRFIGSNNLFIPTFGTVDTANTPSEDCVYIGFGEPIRWSFEPCTDSTSSYICEKPAVQSSCT